MSLYKSNLTFRIFSALFLSTFTFSAHAIECERYYLDYAGWVGKPVAESAYPKNISIEDMFFRPVKLSSSQMKASSEDFDFGLPRIKYNFTLMRDSKLIVAAIHVGLWEYFQKNAQAGVARYECNKSSLDLLNAYGKEGVRPSQIKKQNRTRNCSIGTLDFSGICNAESISTGTNMNIDKAKSTCTELGFQSGTEKHGECVLKLMDR